MTLDQIKTFHICCTAIIKAAQGSSPNSFMQYAASYARDGLRIDHPEYVQSQIPYLLNNLKHWHSDKAREIKATLRGLQK